MKYTFDNIAGYAREKEELKRLCDIFNNREEFEKKGAHLPKGVIFYGDTGTGKTLFSNVLANECNLNVVKIDLANVDDESQICKNIKEGFAMARESKVPTMIFFDEIDKVLPNAYDDYVSDRAKTILAQLLTLIDGMDSANNIVFVATCNDYGVLPDSLVRPGRIDKKIGFYNPDYQSRKEIINMYCAKSPCTFALNSSKIAKLTSGLACASLMTVINECILRADSKNNVSEELIEYVIAEIKQEGVPTLPPRIDDEIIAVRNIGAMIVGQCMTGGGFTLSLSRTTVCNNKLNEVINEAYYGFSDGNDYDDEEDCDEDYDDCDEEDCNDCDDFDDFDDDDDDNERAGAYKDKMDYANAICALMGGIVSNEQMHDHPYDCTRKFYYVIDSILLEMAKNGLLGYRNHYDKNIEDDFTYPMSYKDNLFSEFMKIKDRCYIQALHIIESNAELIEKLVPILVDKRRIEQKECEDLIKEFGGIK